MRSAISPASSSCPASATTALVSSRCSDGVALGALIGDKAFDSDWLRVELNERGALAVIPSNASRATTISHDAEMYKWRHLVENFFQKIKEFRRIATRYDKTDVSFRASIHLVATVLALK
jgi:transposase